MSDSKPNFSELHEDFRGPIVCQLDKCDARQLADIDARQLADIVAVCEQIRVDLDLQMQKYTQMYNQMYNQMQKYNQMYTTNDKHTMDDVLRENDDLQTLWRRAHRIGVAATQKASEGCRE